MAVSVLSVTLPYSLTPFLSRTPSLHSYRLPTLINYLSVEYDGNCNPGILNEFATAAFRFGHSLIRRSLRRMDTSFSESHGGVELRNTFFNPDML